MRACRYLIACADATTVYDVRCTYAHALEVAQRAADDRGEPCYMRAADDPPDVGERVAPHSGRSAMLPS